MKLLVATKNPSKAKELAKFLGPSFEVVTLADLPGAPDVEETGTTLHENAELKARVYFAWSGIPSVADDGGLEIHALGGEPGIMSRRWPFPGEEKPYREKTDEELVSLALLKLSGMPAANRTAALRSVGAFFDGTRLIVETAAVDGAIAAERSVVRQKGYPFNSLFVVAGAGKLYQDLTPEEHERFNHRRVVYHALRERILAAS